MANACITIYEFSGKLPEEFNKLTENIGPVEVGEIFGFDLKEDRWYTTQVDLDEDKASIEVYSAWTPRLELWQDIAKKYGLQLTYLAMSDCPYYFDSNLDKYAVFFNYEDEWYDGEYDYFDNLDQVRSFVEDLDEYTVVGRTDPEDWYCDTESLDFITNL